MYCISLGETNLQLLDTRLTYKSPAMNTPVRMVFWRCGMLRLWMIGKGRSAVTQSVTMLTAALLYL